MRLVGRVRSGEIPAPSAPWRVRCRAGALRCADDGLALAVALRPWLADPAEAARAGAAGRALVEAERGATARTFDVLAARWPALRRSAP